MEEHKIYRNKKINLYVYIHIREKNPKLINRQSISRRRLKRRRCRNPSDPDL